MLLRLHNNKEVDLYLECLMALSHVLTYGEDERVEEHSAEDVMTCGLWKK